jgi:hypothetical protein
VSPITRCEGCNTQWCKTCEVKSNVWYKNSPSHPYTEDGYWMCPVAGKVTLLNKEGLTTVGKLDLSHE